MSGVSMMGVSSVSAVCQKGFSRESQQLAEGQWGVNDGCQQRVSGTGRV